MGAEYETRGTKDRQHPIVHGPCESLVTRRAHCHVSHCDCLQKALCCNVVEYDNYQASAASTKTANVLSLLETSSLGRSAGVEKIFECSKCV